MQQTRRERTGAALCLALHRRVLVQLADRAPVEVLAVDVAVVEESGERAQRPRQRLRLRTARTTAPARVRNLVRNRERFRRLSRVLVLGKVPKLRSFLQNIQRLFASRNLRKPAPDLSAGGGAVFTCANAASYRPSCWPRKTSSRDTASTNDATGEPRKPMISSGQPRSTRRRKLRRHKHTHGLRPHMLLS